MMKLSKKSPKVIVIGSSAIDKVVQTNTLPQPSEFVEATKSAEYFGGKGANQAVGMARLGANVYFVGCVGIDSAGQQIMRNLVNENVNVGFVAETEKDASGSTFITKSKTAYSVVLIPGANRFLELKHIDAVEKHLKESDLLLVQLEVSDQILLHSISKAKSYGKKVGLYASPARLLPPETIEQADFIIAKNNELSAIFPNESQKEVLKRLEGKIFVRDENNSTYFFDEGEWVCAQEEINMNNYKIGMGDGFTCGFAFAMMQGYSLQECVRLGNKVSAGVSLQEGAQNGLPKLKEIL